VPRLIQIDLAARCVTVFSSEQVEARHRFYEIDRITVDARSAPVRLALRVRGGSIEPLGEVSTQAQGLRVANSIAEILRCGIEIAVSDARTAAMDDDDNPTEAEVWDLEEADPTLYEGCGPSERTTEDGRMAS
jgi:hypothetical protein